MDFLIVGVSNIGVLPNIAHVANSHNSHAILVERGDQSRGLLVFDIGYLVFDLLQLSLFGTNEPLAAFAPFVHPAIDPAREFGLELVAILHLGTEQSSIEQVGVLAIMRNRHVDFAQIDASYLTRQVGSVWLFQLVSGDRLILFARPVDHDRVRQIPSPFEHQRRIPLAVGEPQFAILEHHRRTFVLDPEVPLAPAWWVSIGIALFFAFSPTLERGEESLYAGISSMGMQLLAGEEPHQVFGHEPYILVPDRTPEEDHRLAIELATFSCQFIQLCCFADLDAAYPIFIHMSLFLLSVRNAAIGITLGARAKVDIRLTAQVKSRAACGGLKPFTVSMNSSCACCVS